MAHLVTLFPKCDQLGHCANWSTHSRWPGHRLEKGPGRASAWLDIGTPDPSPALREHRGASPEGPAAEGNSQVLLAGNQTSLCV